MLQLHARGIKHVWVEGGPAVASQFVEHNLVNEYLVYLAPMLLGGANTALQNIGVASMPQAKDLQINETHKLGNDLLIVAAPASAEIKPAAAPKESSK
jgi:diaminohydroxyphosphoribosylaminopyrimidine deaminase/5-amino-6-(5-phosphoribosylamino)uracil reductase